MRMGGRNLLNEGAIFHEPSVMTSFMEVHRPSKDDTPAMQLHDESRITYFQNYRNEMMSRFVASSPRDWEERDARYIPKPIPGRVLDHQKYMSIPNIRITTIDAGRMKEVDDLYKVVQMHRQQYKDYTGTLHPLEYFNPDEQAFRDSSRISSFYLFKYPNRYVRYKTPLVLPLTYGRNIETPYMPKFAFPGIYAPGSCIAYKR